MASTPSLMNVSIWLICTLTSLVPSATRSSTSSYFSASAWAAEVIAPIQPWSAAGAEKPMVTVSPGSSLAPGGRRGGAAAAAGLGRRGVFEVQAATRAAAADQGPPRGMPTAQRRSVRT